MRSGLRVLPVALTAAAVAVLTAVQGVGAGATTATAATAATAAKAAPKFGAPVYVTQGPDYQAGEPSIRVDRRDPNGRIWVVAPSGIGVDTRSLPGTPDSGDLFWYSDDDGQTWTYEQGNAGVGSPTVLGGGDSDVAVGYGGQVYGTGLTLANITLAASCDNGGTWTTNPISNANSGEDRQWIDAYSDNHAPSGAPDFVLDYGDIAAQHVVFHQVFSPQCAPPVAGPVIDVTHPDCEVPQTDPDCYQWAGNDAIDERSGDCTSPTTPWAGGSTTRRPTPSSSPGSTVGPAARPRRPTSIR